MWSGTNLHEFISERMASRPRRLIHSRNQGSVFAVTCLPWLWSHHVRNRYITRYPVVQEMKRKVTK